MRQALGKGIGALIPAAGGRAGAIPTPAPKLSEEAGPADRQERVLDLPVELITVNPRQPRDTFDEAALRDLSASIAAHGVLQPILVRRLASGRFELIAGERRLRAARLAGLATIPALAREAAEDQSLVLAVVENIQRADLSPLEEARAYRELIDDFALTQDEIASHVGKSRPAVANTLRLLSLPEAVQGEIASGRLSPGHARALLSLESDAARLSLAREAVERKLTVRQTEAAAARAKAATTTREAADPDLQRLISDLSRALGTKVAVRVSRGGAGRIEVDFFSHDDLARLSDLLLSASRGGPRH